MARRGIDIGGQRPKDVDTLEGEHFDVVITLCDSIREICPRFAGSPELVHWSLPDPAQAAAPEEMRANFELVAEEISRRVRYLVILLDERLAGG
jgi:protein-tyrosine-phosphatase